MRCHCKTRSLHVVRTPGSIAFMRVTAVPGLLRRAVQADVSDSRANRSRPRRSRAFNDRRHNRVRTDDSSAVQYDESSTTVAAKLPSFLLPCALMLNACRYSVRALATSLRLSTVFKTPPCGIVPMSSAYTA